MKIGMFALAVVSTSLLLAGLCSAEEREFTDLKNRKIKATLQSASVNLMYDNTNYAKYGKKYYGWLAVVQDAEGKILSQRSVPETLVKYTANILPKGAHTDFDKNMKPVPHAAYKF